MHTTPELIHKLRTLYPTHPIVLQAAQKLDQLQTVVNDIAGSMKRDWRDPVEHANWCVERAQEVAGGQQRPGEPERAAAVKAQA